MSSKIGIIISTLLMCFLLLFSKACSGSLHVTDIENINVESNDGCISVSWDNPRLKAGENVMIDIYDSAGVVLLESVSVQKGQERYIFQNGEHGKLYQIDIYIYNDTLNKIGGGYNS